MPETTITIDRDQRAGLYELVRNHLGSIEDFWVALERTKDFAAAERLGEEFAEDFRLLRDIGWSEYDVREGYVLTTRPRELSALLERLREEASTVLAESRRGRERDDASDRRFHLGADACGAVLVKLAGLEGDERDA